MRIITLSLLCSLLFTATGCLKVNQSLIINADGSGVLAVKYAVSNQAVRQLVAMRKLQQQMTLASGSQSQDDKETGYAYRFLMPEESDLRREFEKYETLGLKIEKLKVTTNGIWQNVEIKLRFDSLSNLAKTEPFAFVGFDLLKNSKGDYVFYRESRPPEGFTAPDLSNPTTARLLSPIFAGFEIHLSVKTPGQILRTNASRKSTYVSEWIYDFEKDPTVIAKIQTAKLVTIFDSTGLTLPEIRH